ncbi:L-serine dehydratase [Paenibacillus castaneae]|uniref:L-serine ammonia-lyase, iron-sulfur-dependent subunit beta n=1 Tax=Paenibacillus castaneae TaxID=474957 RepID=UPI000C9CFBDB|nr:L-serine ammonia-lyase, iron-sulfur-dependent subunit beta [Paenibacillus castaneae]NIK76937.1 L-serine dehydratase [Paenibacillus castaneae]
MRFKDVFSIIGPSMIGPSSSHTAGAARIGRAARKIYGEFPEQVEIIFYGSFAETYSGHGSDLAIVAGLLDYNTDDIRIRDSVSIAETMGMSLSFQTSKKPSAHPNTVMLKLKGKGRQEDSVIGASIGGGNIEISAINDFDVKFTMNYPTLLVFHNDRPGIVADITAILGSGGVNIGCMDVDRKGRNGDALTVIETDEAVPLALIERIRGLQDIHRICEADLTDNEVKG